MSNQIRKIVNASQLVENIALAEDLFDHGNNNGERYFSFDHVHSVKGEHDHEGIYEIVMAQTTSEVSKLYRDLRQTVEKAVDELGLKFEYPTIEQFVERKTGDGRKLFKAFNQLKAQTDKIMKDRTESFEKVVEALKGLPVSDYTISSLRQEAFASVLRVQSWLEDEVAQLHQIDQKGGLKTTPKTYYARLSFRCQDVIGMTALGRFSSCQDVVSRGFDEYASKAVASMASRGIGTLTLHDSLESATLRDTADDYSDFDFEDKAIARVNVLQDNHGTLAHNDSYYTDNKFAEMSETVKLLTDAGIFQDGSTLNRVSIAKVVTPSIEYTFTYEGELSMNLTLDEVTETQAFSILQDVLTDNLDLSTEEEDELDGYEMDDMLNRIREEGLESESVEALIQEVNVTNFDTVSRWVEFHSSEIGMDLGIEDSEVVELLDYAGYDFDEEVMNYLSCGLDLEDVINYLSSGKMELEIMASLEIEKAMDEEEAVTPYYEGLLDDLDYTHISLQEV